MRTAIIRFCLMLAAASLLNAGVAAQTPNTATNKATATVSGRITLGEQGAPNVEVLLTQNQQGMIGPNIQQAAPLAATTDSEGRYQLTSVPAGRYRLTAYAPAHVVQGESRNYYEAGKTLTVAEGETVENLDFSLVRGGVITGQVTDADGKPVVEERIVLFRVRDNDRQQRPRYPGYSDGPPAQTDDRGVYRIFGLEAGRYRIAAGAAGDDGFIRMGAAGGHHRRTFHPDAVAEAEAKIVEVDAGEVEENVDIKLARAAKGFAASGRVVDGETGKPVAGVMIGIGVVRENSTNSTSGQSATNSRGEFRLEGLTPNTYMAFVPAQGGDSYSEPTPFEIAGGDVTGLEIKMHRGGSVSGVAVLEGVKDPAILAQLAKVRIEAWVETNNRTAELGSNHQPATINADGSFRISGLRPGKIHIQPAFWNMPRGFVLSRIEHNGAEVKDLDLSAGEQITGVRLVLAYGQGSIVGRVEVKGGALPPGVRMNVRAHREGQGPNMEGPGSSAEVDSRGQFLLEGLAAGNYKLRLQVWSSNANEPPPRLSRVEQAITVSGNIRQEAVLVLDLTPKEGRQ